MGLQRRKSPSRKRNSKRRNRGGKEGRKVVLSIKERVIRGEGARLTAELKRVRLEIKQKKAALTYDELEKLRETPFQKPLTDPRLREIRELMFEEAELEIKRKGKKREFERIKKS